MFLHMLLQIKLGLHQNFQESLKKETLFQIHLVQVFFLHQLRNYQFVKDPVILDQLQLMIFQILLYHQEMKISLMILMFIVCPLFIIYYTKTFMI